MIDFYNYLLITDLDGTFFGKGGRMVPRNPEALARFRAGGGAFTIATGRLHLNVRKAIPDIATLCNAPVVMSNGAYLYDFATRSHLYEQFLDPADARELVAFSKENFSDVQFRVSTPNCLRIEELTGYLLQDAAHYDEGALRVEGNARNWCMEDWYKIVYRGEPERLAEVRAAIVAHFGTHLSVTRSGERTIEIQPSGCTKAAGVEKLRTLLAARGEERRIIACGDFENDIEMLEAADIAVCPANALPEVKAVADFVLCHHDEGLIADVIEHLECRKIK